MKYLTLILTIVLLASCNPSSTDQTEESEHTVTYDSTLAKELGADEYGMKRYVMAFLVAGPNRSHSKEDAAEIQRAHLDNIGQMVEEGKLVLAGPFLDDGTVRGIYVFNTESVEEAEAWTATDPAIKAGRLKMELHPWYASGTLPLIKEWHKKVQKKDI